MTAAAVPALAEVDAAHQRSSNLEIREKDGFKGVFAKADIEINSFVKLEGVVSGHPTKYSIQLDENTHLNMPTDEGMIDSPDFFWRYLNHSCQPNGYINTVELAFRPLRKISKGEQCTFNYLTTEYEMAAPFDCLCGAAKCFGFIRGYKHLSREGRETNYPLSRRLIRPLEADSHPSSRYREIVMTNQRLANTRLVCGRYV